jgi:uncharacterized protein with HEPN domain
MFDIIKERLMLILQHAQTIQHRMQGISSADDFINSEAGEVLLDSIITRLQALAENFKKIEKIDPGFTRQHLGIDAAPIIRFRDLAAHHYESLNHHIIFAICRQEIPILI